MMPSRGARAAMRSLMRAGTPVRRSTAAASSSVVVRALAARRAEVDRAVERHELAQPLAAAAARDADRVRVGDHRRLEHARAPGRDEHADRRRLRALALRVGRVLDVGAGVDRAVLGAQRGADVEARVRRVRAAHRLARGGDQRVGAEQAVAVGVGEDLARCRARAAGARPSPARVRGRTPAGRRPRARRTSRAPRTVSRWMRTPSHRNRWRSLSTTTSVPSAASSDARRSSGSSTRVSR